MLLQFKCSNHRSIKDKISFTMLAGPDDTRENFLTDYGKYRVSRTAVIYGANGSGKSNFIDALSFMEKLVTRSADNKLDELIEQHPHKLSKEGTPSEYHIQFVYNKVRYAYGFAVKDGHIHSEYLHYFPRNKQTKVFERIGQRIQPGDKYKNTFDVCKKGVLQPNKLLLSCAANNTEAKAVKEAFRFFSKGLMIFSNIPLFDSPLFDLPFLGGIDFSADALMNDKFLKEAFLMLLHKLGTNIKDVKIKRHMLAGQKGTSQKELPGFFGKLLAGPEYDIKLVYGKFETDLAREESKGVKRLFQILVPILLGMWMGDVLVFDEMELSLHERILIDVVKIFQESQPGREKGSQLIFSTHDTNLLDSDLFRRDQIWFTELDPDTRATDLYSLAEIRNVRKYENLAKGYISGKYGAIPMCNEDGIREVLESFGG